MANHEILNEALCKYKGNANSPDDILNYKNSKGLLLSRGNANLTSHLWVGFPFILPQSLINATKFKIQIHLYTGNDINRQDRFSVNQKTQHETQTKQRIGVYFSNTKYGEYNDFAKKDRTSTLIENKTEPYIIELQKNSMSSDAETFGIVLMDQTTYDGTIVAPKITIEKIQFYIKDQIIEEFDFCDYDLNSSPFKSSPNEQDIATIVYKDEVQAEENKLKLSKGDIYSVNNKHIVWNGIEWKLLGNNPDLSKYQLAEDNALNTEDKTIVGAINEVQTNAFGRIALFDQFKQDKISVIEESGLRWEDEGGTVLSINLPYLKNTLPLYQQVNNLDEVTEYNDKIIYLVKNPQGAGNNQYDAYVYIKEGVETPYFDLLSGDSSNTSSTQLLYVQKYATLMNGQYTITTENISNIKHSIILNAAMGTTINAQQQSWEIDTSGEEILIDNLDTTYPITFTSYSPFMVKYAINTEFIATKDYVNKALSGALTRKIEDRSILDDISPSYELYPSNIIYMIPNETELNNIYDEYMNVNNKWEQIGSTEMDLNGYVTSEAWDSHMMEYIELAARITALENSQGAINEVLEDVY